MILVYPMLTSGSISPNVLPGLTKTLEKFVIVYGTDKILKAINMSLPNVNINLHKSKLVMTECDQKFSEVTLNIPSTKQQGKGKPISVDTSPAKSGKSSGRTSVNFPKTQDGISVEPTWINVETPKRGMQVLGIKVLPFPVQSDDSLTRLLLTDQGRKMGDFVYTKYKRMAIRIMFRIARTLKIPGLKDKVLTGNAETDILWATTQYKHNMFVCFNQLELEQDEMFSKPGTVQKLHKLGWSSFIIADDVNKKATFCMKEFGGLCSTVPYSFMFSSLGKDHNKVYEDLEDVRRSAGPFFRMVTSKTKVFSEATILSSKHKFLDVQLERMELLEQEVGQFAKKLDQKKMINRLTQVKSAIKSNDESKLKTALEGIPRIEFARIEKFCKNFSKDFKKNYELGKRVIANSTKLNSKMINYTSCIIALGASKSKEPDETMKESLKNFIFKTRKKAAAGDTIMENAEILGEALKVSIVAIAAIAIASGTGIAASITAIIAAIKALPVTVVVIAIIAITLLLLVLLSTGS